MATLLDAITAHNASRPGPQCTVADTLAKLGGKMRDQLAAALADTTIKSTAIMRGLAEHGHKLDYTALRRHRNGDCACGR